MKTSKTLQNSLSIIAIFLSSFAFGQAQTEYINYQGVARDASNEIIANESIQIGISLRFGLPTSAVLYSENHTVTTDISGVFSLQIGTGDVTTGIYKDLEWGKLAPYASITLNGNDVGTVAMYSVPYANSSGKATNMQLNDLTDIEGTPTNNQVLKWNGTAWIPDDISGSSSLWKKNADNIYYNSGDVSIGGYMDYAKMNVIIDASETDDDTPYNISSLNSYSGDQTVVGIINRISGSGSGVKSGFSTSIENGTGSKTGYRSSITQNGGTPTSTSAGFSSSIINNSDNVSYGFYSSTSGVNSGPRYGIYSRGDDRNYLEGNLGLNIQDPKGRLHIKDYYANGDRPFIELTTADGDRSDIKYSKVGSTDYWHQIAGIRTDRTSGTMSFYYIDNNASTQDQVMTLRGDGNVGIGTSSPTAKLEISGDVKITGEINRPSTGAANMVPIAYGTVLPTLNVYGTNNYTIIKVPSVLGVYDIKINSENIQPNTHMIIVSIQDSVGSASYRFESNGFRVFTRQLAEPIDSSFSFIVYKM